MLAWIKRKWAEISTKLGLLLGAAVSAAQLFGGVKPELAYVGFAASVLLILFKEQPSA